MSELRVRTMTAADRFAVAELIHVSLVHWYSLVGRRRIFHGGPRVCEIFFDVYQAMDPGCGIVVENTRTGVAAASCFYHPRPHHLTLGILNVHPNYFGAGAGRMMVDWIADYARRAGKPLRLTSSAINLDSFSLYNKAGFVPRTLFQDMMIPVPEQGLAASVPGAEKVRTARPDDVPAMARLEWDVSRITREIDCAFCIDNHHGMWHVSVHESAPGRIDGWTISSRHEAINMIGPLVARDTAVALALLRSELNHHRGRSPICLVPCQCRDMVDEIYRWGGKNTELHLYQSLGDYHEPDGVTMPVFLPETG